MSHPNSFGSRATLTVGDRQYAYFRLAALDGLAGSTAKTLPFSLRVLLENLLRGEDNAFVKQADVEALARWNVKAPVDKEIAFRTARVLLQDFTGVPCVVDLAAMRDAMVALGGDPTRINPLQPVDLVIDHSVQVDEYGTDAALLLNTELEFERNGERYQFLKWGQTALRNFRAVPPGTGICHQVNLEYLAQVVFTAPDGSDTLAYCDSLVGTDSHTTMINGLGVLGWGVGGIEAEAAMLGQPVSMLIPEVIGFRLHGKLPAGATATDLVLTCTEMLRKKKVVGKFVEFYGPGLSSLALADRATIANMAPEYGATMGFFPVDAETLKYLRLSGRSDEQVALVEAYCKAQGLFRTDDTPDPVFTDTLELDLSTVVPSLAGPKRPQDRVPLSESKRMYREALAAQRAVQSGTAANGAAAATMVAEGGPADAAGVSVTYKDQTFTLTDGHVVIAAITSCTNTSNPSVMLAAGLLAQKAVAKGLTTKPWVKTSLAPGSKVATEYFHKAGLMDSLDALGFNVVGYGCTTCIGNSGPLPTAISEAIDAGKLNVAAVLSGNRNFEGRVNPQTRFNYLASPPLVVAYALAGRMDIDMATEPLGVGTDGPVFLRDIWPTPQEVEHTILESVKREQFTTQYADVFKGDKYWQEIAAPVGDQYAWDGNSTYVKNPPYFEGMTMTPPGIRPIAGAKVLGMFGDSITTDHISPAGSIAAASPAGRYLTSLGVEKKDFNSYGARRGNHEVMMRGTFANIRLKNELTGGKEGWWTATAPGAEPEAIYDVSMARQAAGVPQIVIAGKEYGTGSSRDWAAKGTMLLGVRAVIAESFERIHRSNLVGMGVLPCEFVNGETRQSLGLTGFESYEIVGLDQSLTPRATLTVKATAMDGAVKTFSVRCRIDTPEEMQYYTHGGILPYVLRSLVSR
ncbi:aconitate hydratase AcnA [Gemmatimonas sp.]|jgi:aconitate hydratase|uniref:aconitate hydratase AcnA n=1 Tax=Gemmatimonas sp. TaxID=1962908 RepID=UPI0022C34C15|nr:aconitate hydratase AcnA [Gemmatimonas sp.]MCA2982968.1 aconitate hydratase AcnA [Gemmatimonas sp.]MCA2989185.1 aconitate hydratase AcnA [Gemmatimonas sp.]MCA2991635.1 aconitate hydratase AcnA [Gemmatimonas sp.]MCA2994899.1 aconitate hydratase AcnA [Gemmatimonas sp.]MCE2954767.1 aconitate hydratase AcnA [Gemmatimonas sp.]